MTIAAIKADLGKALMEGDSKAVERLKKELAKAEAHAFLDAVEQEAIDAAKALLAKQEADAAEARRMADIEARWTQAQVDHADIMATANALQRNWEKQRELLLRLRNQSRAFSDNHRDLGCKAARMGVLRNQNWLPQLLLLLRESIPDMRWRMQHILIEGCKPTGTIPQCVPSFEEIFPQRAAQKEAA